MSARSVATPVKAPRCPPPPEGAGVREYAPSARAESALDDRERQFAEVQGLAHIGSWELDPVTRRATWSDELCRIFGRPLGHSPTWEEFLAYVHPDDRDGLGPRLDGALEGGESGSAYRIHRPDGELRHVFARRHGRTDADGRIVHLYGTIQDVTEQRVAEEERVRAQQLFELAFSQAPTGMALTALDGRWMKVNAQLCRMLGYAEEELLARCFKDLTHPDDLDGDLFELNEMLAGRSAGFQREKRYITATGEALWVNLSVSVARGRDGRPLHFISQMLDISQRKRAEQRLRQAEYEARMQRDHAQTIIGAMHEGYALTLGGQITAVNSALCALTGFSEAELVGARIPFPFWPPEREDETLRLTRQIVAQEGGTFSILLMRRNGERFEAEITAKAARDAEGKVLGFVNTLRDVSLQRRQQLELERLARTDSLTGLANRHVLQEALDRAAALAHRQSHRLALVLLDIDHFKQINDRHGHPAGDAVLIEVAQRLAATVRAGEVLARVGGEEFAWLLPDARIDEAIVAADRARTAISAVPFLTAGRLTMSAGVGVMLAPGDGDALYRLADRALYDAKQSGRDRTCSLSSGLDGVEAAGPGVALSHG